ncbi:hypothetical protein [Leuconostoc citreum]
MREVDYTRTLTKLVDLHIDDVLTDNEFKVAYAIFQKFNSFQFQNDDTIMANKEISRRSGLSNVKTINNIFNKLKQLEIIDFEKGDRNGTGKLVKPLFLITKGITNPVTKVSTKGITNPVTKVSTTLTSNSLVKAKLSNNNTPTPQGGNAEPLQNTTVNNSYQAKEMLAYFNQRLGRDEQNAGLFSSLVLKNISVAEFKDVVNWVATWSEDTLFNTTAATIAKKFESYSDKAAALGFRDGNEPKKKGRKPEKISPSFVVDKRNVTQPMDSAQIADEAKAKSALEALKGIKTSNK